MRAVRATPAPRPVSFRLRLAFAFGLLALAGGGLALRAVQLQLVQHTFLEKKGLEKFQVTERIAAHRGMITDRNGEPLAVSTPVDSVKLTQRDFDASSENLHNLARALGADQRELAQRISTSQDRPVVYLARGLQPAVAHAVDDLGVPGVSLEPGYRRYYPAGEVALHVIGYTNVDDDGQSGAELAWDSWMAGEEGSKRVIQSRKGERVDLESLKPVVPGQELRLSIDQRLQYLAYRALKLAVADNKARAGSLVMIDVRTGEVLAMVNQPAFNPNDRKQYDDNAARNRAATDLFEPGSGIKPFFVAAGLASGRFNANSVIDTGPGFVQINASTTFTDEHNLGAVPLSVILAKSSNVGMAKLALALEPRQIWGTLNGLGFGRRSDSGFPGESAGVLSDYSHWRNRVTVATMSHGYGLSVTALQLAQAYATLGALGVRRPVSLLRVDGPVAGERVLESMTCASLLRLLESVVSDEGTGKLAYIPGYRVAGKTGTAEKLVNGAYDHARNVGSFSGVAPASDPRFAMVVVIDEPNAGKHHGGEVAAPVFATVMGGALRLMGVPPDDVPAGSDALRLGTQVAAR
ncbi:MAG: hypothetical protein RL684_2288 [Pseudomonadota bacterium]|jgi:cell division protein FtsI (penicillin-binding protein 3)